MGLFGNSGNKKVEKLINKLEKQGITSSSYKSRKHCGICGYYPSSGFCNKSGKKSSVSDCCHSFYRR